MRTHPVRPIPPNASDLKTTLLARVIRHDRQYGMSTLYFGDGELRVPLVDAPVDTGVQVEIEARDVSIALARPMDISITNRLPCVISNLVRLELPFVRVELDLGSTRLASLVTAESVDRLALEQGLAVWAMIKAVAIGERAVRPIDPPKPRRWPTAGKTD